MATVSLQTVFDQARQAIETGAADKAVGIAQHILVHFPRMIEAHRLLGEAYLNVGEPVQAAAAFEQVLQADPENVAAYYGLGLAQQNIDQRSAAITAFERALEIQPNLADLRTQLMRLYAETPGSAGQFRLSRAGLGRLYARGGMTGQALDEFRAVLDADPDRDDVKVALAEALWRDGQEDEATDFCRDILEYRRDLHKPTLLLGYLLFASGQPEGEALWRRAAEQDASLTVARTLFDVLPPIRLEDPVLPEFDEAEWRAQSARRAAEQSAPAPVSATADEEDFFADSWLASAGSSTAANTARTYDAASLQPAAPNSVDDDDLLASLLGLDSAAPSAGSSVDVGANSVQPFALDDWNTQSGQNNQSAPMPASLNDFGLEDQDRAPQDEAVKPFSFDDWSFDEPAETLPSQTASNTAQDFDISGVQGFSLDDTTAASDNVRPFNFEAAAPASDIQPFSLDDDADTSDIQPFSFEDEPTSSGVQPFSFEDEPTSSGVQPFSLDDEPTSSGVQPFSLDDDEFGAAPFSFESEAKPTNQPSADAGLGAVQPFSLDDWSLDDEIGSAAASAPQPSGSASSDQDDLGGFQPFSLDDLSLDTLESETDAALTEPQLPAAIDDSDQSESFSWQEPSWRAQQEQNLLGGSNEGDSIFAKLMRNRPAPTEEARTTPASSNSDDSDVEPSFFSLDDEALRFDDDPAQFGTGYDVNPVADASVAASEFAPSSDQAATDFERSSGSTFLDESDALNPASDENFFASDASTRSDPSLGWSQAQAESSAPQSDETDFAPFSLSELGLSDDDLPALGETPAQPPAAADDVDLSPFSLTDLGLSEEDLAMLDASNPAVQPDASQPSDMDATPFSLADLGLSDDEIAALDLQEDANATEDALPAFDLHENAAFGQDTLDAASSDLATFDLHENLSDSGNTGQQSEAFAQGGAQDAVAGDDQAPTASLASDNMSEEAEAGQTPDMTPFSLADLGLSDEEIALLNAQDVSIGDQAVSNDTPAVPAEFEAQTAGDESEAVPGATPDDGQASENAWVDWGVEDGGTPFGFETADDQNAQAVASTEGADFGGVAPATDDAPDMTPFSLADLGLSDEEMTFFEQAQAEQSVNDETEAYGSEQVEGSVGTSDAADRVNEQASFADVGTDATPSDHQLFGADIGEAQESVAETTVEQAGAERSADVPAAKPEAAQPVGDTQSEQPLGWTSEAAPVLSGDLQDIHAQLAADPNNDIMRLAVARITQQTSDVGQAIDHYKQLIKRGQLLDDVVVDLQDIIAETDDPQALRRLHRVLGDAFMKQNRFREAMDQYSWTLSRQ